MSRTIKLLCPAIVALAQACVPRYVHDQQVAELTEALGKRNAEMGDVDKIKASNERLATENEMLRAHREAYDGLSEDVREALKNLKSEGVDQVPDRGCWTIGTDLLFRSGSSEVTPQGQRLLKKFVEALRGKDLKVRVVGHTDTDRIHASLKQNPTGLNLELGFHRALKVMEVLHRAGVREENMWVESRGMSDPLSKPASSVDAKRKNRRVEIFVFGTEPQPASSGSR